MVEHALRAGDEALIPEEEMTTHAANAVRPATVRLAGAEGLGSVEGLMRECQPRLFRYFLLNLRDEDAARSLTQDTFVKAWRSAESFRGECAPSTWLMRIAINLLRDHVRGGKYKFWKKASAESVDAVSMAEVLPSSDGSAERTLLARERVAEMWQAVEQLSDRQRSIFVMRHVDEMELAEIAAATGLPLPTVKTHLYRSLERVRNAMRREA